MLPNIRNVSDGLLAAGDYLSQYNVCFTSSNSDRQAEQVAKTETDFNDNKAKYH
jgi:hypothetical protein